ncbi:glycosyltransferase [Sulfurimonas sp. HSL3-7]|uniref:glycosyltransferase n=1 Tax=Sulfonitrofixus jiaomeiensis TaxID=3131938 RepID=UPI0031F8CC92
MLNETRPRNAAMIVSVYKNDTLPVVKEMFQSLFVQSRKEFDILVQEDGRVDPELDAYLDALYRQKKITHLGKREQNMGLAYSLNELVEFALQQEYAFIFRMDADDIAVPKRIEQQLDYFKTHPETDILGGWIEEFNTDTGARQRISYPEYHDDILSHMVKRNPMAHVTVAFRTSFFRRFGHYDENSRNEDFRLWVEAFDKGARFHNLQEVLVYVRTNNAFYSRRKNRARAIEVMKIKFDATRRFNFGIKGYLYALTHYLLFMAPSVIKQVVYKYFR